LEEEPVRTENKGRIRRWLPWLVVPTALVFLAVPSLTRPQSRADEDKPMDASPTSYDQIAPVLLPPPGEIGLIYPLVPGHGGVVPLLRAAEQPGKGAKAVFDITAGAKPGEVNKGLEQVARLLNLYGAAGLKAGDVKIAAVFHGEADKAVLSDAVYFARFKVAANPNPPLIRDLKKAGVEVFVCGQSLHELGFKAEEVAEEVPVADSAMLVLVNKQADGYAYIPAR
jgi:intracellular sulfur oxidation DsrE/DsrF family protein